MGSLEEYLRMTTKRLLMHGHDLIVVSSHTSPCPRCAVWQGRILSITGKTPGYPTLKEARKAGLFHEGCRHAIGAHVDLDKEIRELEADLRQESPTNNPNIGCGCGTLAALLGIAAVVASLLYLL